MRQVENRTHRIEGLVALLIFCIFAVCVLMVLLTGAKEYRQLTQRDQAAYRRRTCAQYIATRVRQADYLGGIRVEPFGEGEALFLRENDGYATRVYWYDGYLMELYAAGDAELSPQDGEKVMELSGLSLSLEDGLLTAELDHAGGISQTLRLCLRSGSSTEAVQSEQGGTGSGTSAQEAADSEEAVQAGGEEEAL